MADSIAQVLADLTRAMNAGEDLNNVLDNISKNTKEAFSKGGMAEYLRTLRQVQLQVKELEKAQTAYNQAVSEMEGAETERERIVALDRLNRLAKVRADAEKKVTDVLKEQNEALADSQQELAEKNELLRQNWEQNTKLGAVYRASTSTLAKFTAGVTAGSLAMKAFGKFTDAARMKQELMIKSFRGMDSSENLMDTASSVLELEGALRHASAAAIRFNFDTDQANETMVRFQKIAGTENPQALGAMTEATMAAARVNGVDLNTAMQFVQDRIDKYNGSVSSAIMAMDELNEEAGRINNTFNDTRIRADDVIQSINQITSASNIFAVDQQFLSKVMMRNMNAMQEAGDSYDYAREQATNFMEAVTTKAPEFMRIQVGQSLVNEMNTVLKQGGPEGFMQKFGDQLEAAKPGLAKQVQDILRDTTTDQLTKIQLVQEMTAGLDVGISTMKDQILKLAGQGREGIQVIKSIYGVSAKEAQELVNQAREMKKVEEEQKDLEKDLASIRSASVEEASKIISKGMKYKEINEETGEVMIKQYEIDKQSLELAMKTEGGLKKLVQTERDRLEAKSRQFDQTVKELEAGQKLEAQKKELAKIEAKRKATLEGVEDEGAIRRINAVFDAQADRQKELISKTAKEAGQETTSMMEEFTKKASKFLENTNILNLNQARAFFEEHAGILQFAGMATILAGFQWKFKKTLDNFINRLAGVMQTSGPTGGGDGPWGGGTKGTRPRRAGFFKKLGRVGTIARRGMGRFGRGRIGKAVQMIGNVGSKVAGGAGKLFGATKGIGGKLLKGATKGIGKLAGPLSGLLDLGINLASGEGIGRSAFKAVGSTIGGALGAAGGSLVAPGVGTVAGGAAGGIAGDYLGGKIADFFGFESPEEAKTAMAAQKGMSKDVVSSLQKSAGPKTSMTGGASTLGSGVLQSSGMKQMGDKIMLEIDGGDLLSILGNLQNGAAQA